GRRIGASAARAGPAAAGRRGARCAVVRSAGTVRTETVEGQVGPGSVEFRDFYDETSRGAGDIRIGGTTSAVFTVRPPEYASCPSGQSNVTVTLHRAIDNSATPRSHTL